MSRIHISGFQEKATERQIEELFLSKGRIIFSDIKARKGSGYLEYDDEKSAKNAIEEFNDTEQFGSKLLVEYAKNNETNQRQSHFKRYRQQQYSRSRSYSSSRSRHSRHSHSHRRNNYHKSYNKYSPKSRKEPTSRDKCFVCGKYGHWASQCKEGDGTGVSSGKCFRCNEKGHIARNCPNARKKSDYSSRSNSRSGSYSSNNSRRARGKAHRKNHSSSRSSSSSSRSKSKNND